MTEIAISVGLLVLALVVNHLSGKDAKAESARRMRMEAYLAFVLSAVVGLWLTHVRFQREQELSIRSSVDSVRKDIQRIRADVQDAAALSASDSTRDVMRALVAAEEQRRESLDTLNRRRLLGVIANFSDGFARLESFDETLAYAGRLIAGARDTLRATSYVLPEGFWLRPEVVNYGNAGRRIMYQRLFLIGDAAECDLLAAKVASMRTQKVEVRFVSAAGRNQNQLRDFLLQGSARAIEMELDNRRFVGARAYDGKSYHVRDLKALFETLWDIGNIDCHAALGLDHPTSR